MGVAKLYITRIQASYIKNIGVSLQDGNGWWYYFLYTMEKFESFNNYINVTIKRSAKNDKTCVSSKQCYSSLEHNITNQTDFACSISVARFVHMCHDEVTDESRDNHIPDARPFKHNKILLSALTIVDLLFPMARIYWCALNRPAAPVIDTTKRRPWSLDRSR